MKLAFEGDASKLEAGAKDVIMIQVLRYNMTQEIEYKVEIIDDGQKYITIIPAEADMRHEEYEQNYRRQQQNQFNEDARRQQEQLDEQMREDEMRARGQ